MMKINSSFLAAAMLMLMGCVSPDEQVKIDSVEGAWDAKFPAQFEFEVNDAQNPKNIIFVLRNNNDYPYSNIRLFTSISKKGSKVPLVIDTLNYILAEPNGEWIGAGFGRTKEILLGYKAGFKFPSNGKYDVELKHAMRTNPLKGIEDIGVKIETLKQP